MFIKGVNLRYLPVQYGWSLLFIFIVYPWPKHCFCASNQSREKAPFDLISAQNRNETKIIKLVI